VGVAECWNRLSREIADSPSLEVFKTSLGMILGSLLETVETGPDDLQRCFAT